MQLRIVNDHWEALQKYLDYWNGEYAKNGAKNFDSGFGDWVPAGPKADGHLVGMFAYLHDLELLEELAGAAGDSATAKAIAVQRQTTGKAFHAAFYNASEGYYGTGLQTENAMALWLGLQETGGVIPSEQVLETVLNFTAKDVLETNAMHTTTGIIGIKALFEAMSRLGRADVPVLMSMQTTYPSYGYMITNKYEPATTVGLEFLLRSLGLVPLSLLLTLFPPVSLPSLPLSPPPPPPPISAPPALGALEFRHPRPEHELAQPHHVRHRLLLVLPLPLRSRCPTRLAGL